MTQKELKKILKYNKDTGDFVWRCNISRAKNGNKAGVYDNGYIRIRIKGVLYLAHRLAWLYVYGEMPKGHIDHINRNRSDNRIENLRIVTVEENARNRSKSIANKSGVTGVYWNKKLKKWHSQIIADGKRKHLGYFLDKEEAIKARRDAEVENGYINE